MAAESRLVKQEPTPAKGLAPAAAPIASRYAGDPVVGGLVAEFLHDLPLQLGELELAIRGEDASRVYRLAHRLCGDAATYGYPALAHLANELEIASAPDQSHDGVQWARLSNAMQASGQRMLAVLGHS
jgi:HPt (histidine-containing phosphotransfer) domain-containing protein